MELLKRLCETPGIPGREERLSGERDVSPAHGCRRIAHRAFHRIHGRNTPLRGFRSNVRGRGQHADRPPRTIE